MKIKKHPTTKHKRLMKKQRQNAADRDRRRKAMDEANARYLRKKHEENQRQLRAAQAADPERQLHQRLVNILYRRLSSDPLYQLMQITRFLQKESGMPWYF